MEGCKARKKGLWQGQRTKYRQVAMTATPLQPSMPAVEGITGVTSDTGVAGVTGYTGVSQVSLEDAWRLRPKQGGIAWLCHANMS